MRSIIQLAGRILRHRDHQPDTPNILLLNKNYKALKDKDICFDKPGFEMDKLRVEFHDLRKVLDDHQFKKITSIPRIDLPPANTGKACKDSDGNDFAQFPNLNDLEHKALAWQLFTGEKKAAVWWENQPYWCGEVQRQQRFRQSEKDEAYFLCVDDEHKPPYWLWLNEHVRPAKIGEVTAISIRPPREPDRGRNVYFWFDLRALPIYSELADEFKLELKEVGMRFGELRITEYRNNVHSEYWYHDNLGLYQEITD
jgi:CRISPR-associated endonuclease/helicase Cas3